MPDKNMQVKRIAVAGAGGFIGRRLLPVLLERDLAPIALGRREPGRLPPGVGFRQADLLHEQGLAEALKGADAAVYLVHSLDSPDYAERDRRAAENFRRAAEDAGLKRILYLGGLGGDKDLSPHLASRREVERILAEGNLPLTVLRAGIIIGAGGSSFEILRALVRTQALIPEPPGLATRCQPIAVEDVVGYLAGCLEKERTAGEIFDIGGPEVLSYREMLETFARTARDVNLYFPVPFLPTGAAARWIALVSGVPAQVVRALLGSLESEVVCREERIRKLLPLRLTPYRQAVRKALREGEKRGG